MDLEQIVCVTEPFQLEMADVRAMEKYHQKHPPRKSWGAAIFGVSVGGAMGLIWVAEMAGLLSQERALTAMVTFLVCLVALLVLVFWFAARSRREQVEPSSSRDRWREGPWRVKLTHNGVTNESRRVVAFYRWDVVAEIGETEEHLFLWVASKQAIVIPRRAFASEPMFRIFADQAFRLSEEYGQPLEALPGEGTNAGSTDITR